MSVDENVPLSPPDLVPRTVYQAEALQWMREHPAPPRASVITSLPDLSEVPEMGFARWSQWFQEAALAVLRFCPPPGVAIFYQSDIQREGQWIDKAFWLQQAALSTGHHLVWHKIVCRKPPGTISFERAAYSHMLCFAAMPKGSLRKPGPDVIVETQKMPWPRAMGVRATQVACRFLVDCIDVDTVVDPFCGYGTALAVANAVQLQAIGVDLSAKRCRIARTLQLQHGVIVRPGTAASEL